MYVCIYTDSYVYVHVHVYKYFINKSIGSPVEGLLVPAPDGDGVSNEFGVIPLAPASLPKIGVLVLDLVFGVYLAASSRNLSISFLSTASKYSLWARSFFKSGKKSLRN